MATESSKIPKRISAIYFKGGSTVIHYQEQFSPNGQNEVVKETKIFKSNLPRHDDLSRAMERFVVHMIVRALPFVKPDDIANKLIDKDWFDNHLYEDHPNFMDGKVTGVIITTKEDNTGFYVIGELETVDDQKVKLKSPPISTLQLEAPQYNYPLRSLAEEHLNTLLLEVQEFIKYKSSNPQMRIAYNDRAA